MKCNTAFVPYSFISILLKDTQYGCFVKIKRELCVGTDIHEKCMFRNCRLKIAGQTFAKLNSATYYNAPST